METNLKRDPRKDPKPGDRLLVDAIEGNVTPNRGGFVREVDYIDRGTVTYIVGRFGYRVSLTEWRKLNKKAEVLHAAD